MASQDNNGFAVHAQSGVRDNNRPLEVPLLDAPSDLSKVNQSLLKIRVSLLVEQNQPDASKGLRGTAVFQNGGTEAVSLMEVQSITIFEVLDSEGRRIEIPEKVPDIYINRWPQSGALAFKI